MAEAKQTRTRRSRVRSLDTGNKPAARQEVPAEIKTLATTVLSENKKMNSAKGKHDKARKELTGKLNDLGVENKPTEFSFGTTIESKRVELEVSLVEGQTTVIDMKKLKGLVDEQTWNDLITTTKTAIVNAVGATIADQCVKSKGNGKFTAKVQAAK